MFGPGYFSWKNLLLVVYLVLNVKLYFLQCKNTAKVVWEIRVTSADA